MEIENIGEEKMPSILKDPFKKNCIKRVYVFFSECNDTWSASGNVKFTNGNTDGEQNFKAATFDAVVFEIKNFIKNLE